MKRVKVELDIDSEKFTATQQFMAEKGLKIETELSNSVTRLYKKYGPADVRNYIEGRAPAISSSRLRTRAEGAEGVSECLKRDSETPISKSKPDDFQHDPSE